jgi:hypothetical protein
MVQVICSGCKKIVESADANTKRLKSYNPIEGFVEFIFYCKTCYSNKKNN